MLKNLPQQYRNDPWVVALAAALCGVLDGQDARSASIVEQMSLDTVTWNLETEEHIAGITPPAGASVEDRRSALKARWRSGGRITIEQIQAVADAWKNGEVAVSFPAGRILIQFVSSYGIPTALDELKAAIQMVIPAHLDVEYLFKYLLIEDVDALTLENLETKTIDQFAFGGDAQ